MQWSLSFICFNPGGIDIDNAEGGCRGGGGGGSSYSALLNQSIKSINQSITPMEFPPT